MGIWIGILISVIIVFGLGIWYLLSRIVKFTVIKKLSNDNKKISWIISSAVFIALFTLLSLIFGFINAVIIEIHLVIIWCLCELVLFIVKKAVKTGFKNYYAGISACVITAAYMSYAYFNVHNVAETHYNIASDKNIGSMRVIQITDAHIGATFNAERFREYINEMQNKNPDIVVITGDFVDDSTSREDMLESCKALAEFKPAYGTYFVYGNHDKGYYSEKKRGWTNSEMIKALEESNVKILEDENVIIDNRLCLIGRKDYSAEQTGDSRKSMAELTANIDDDLFTLVLDHQPHDYAAQTNAGVDMVLSGHTHGGQFFPITYAGEWMGVNCMTYGCEKINDTTFIVSSGISNWELKFKTGCISEYVVIDIN